MNRNDSNEEKRKNKLKENVIKIFKKIQGNVMLRISWSQIYKGKNFFLNSFI